MIGFENGRTGKAGTASYGGIASDASDNKPLARLDADVDRLVRRPGLEQVA